MDINACFPSKYVRAVDLEESKNYTLTMTGVRMESMTNRDGQEETKPVLYFQHADKGLVLNVTNAQVIQAAYGPNTEGWAGKRVTLYRTQERAFGEMMDVLRVRVHKAPPNAVDAMAAETRQESQATTRGPEKPLGSLLPEMPGQLQPKPPGAFDEADDDGGEPPF